jgi:hypothetical protein
MKTSIDQEGIWILDMRIRKIASALAWQLKKEPCLNPPLKRLQEVRNGTGLNAQEFAESVGMTAPGFHNMVARSSRVSRVLANSVELIHGIRAKWILMGEGLPRVKQQEHALDRKRRGLNA